VTVQEGFLRLDYAYDRLVAIQAGTGSLLLCDNPYPAWHPWHQPVANHLARLRDTALEASEFLAERQFLRRAEALCAAYLPVPADPDAVPGPAFPGEATHLLMTRGRRQLGWARRPTDRWFFQQQPGVPLGRTGYWVGSVDRQQWLGRDWPAAVQAARELLRNECIYRSSGRAPMFLDYLHPSLLGALLETPLMPRVPTPPGVTSAAEDAPVWPTLMADHLSDLLAQFLVPGTTDTLAAELALRLRGVAHALVRQLDTTLDAAEVNRE
jgi:hypothetical protein